MFATRKMLALPLIAALGLATASGPARAADPRPNIVVIMTDDQTLESLRVLPRVKTLIGDQGTTFGQNLVSYPLCCPSRATFLTGQYPHNHDVFDNKENDGGYDKLRKGETLPVWLGRAGYKTVHIGKYLNGYQGEVVPPGWEYWHGLVCAYRMWGFTFKHNDQPAPATCSDAANAGEATYQTNVLRNLATNFIENHFNGERPFFLSLAPLAPHTEVGVNADLVDFRNPRPSPEHRLKFNNEPLPRSPAFDEADMSDKPAFLRRGPLTENEIDNITKRYRSRLESLLSVDDAVKAVVDKLREKAILSKTVIIFTSDNGFMDGQHRIDNGKVVAYTPSARVPLLMRGPGIPVNHHVSQLVSNVDLAATVLDIANATPGITIDGMSLIQIAQNPASIDGRAVLIETGESGARTRGERWYAAIRTERYLYVEHWLREADGVDRRTATELYDHNIDGFQLESKHDNPGYNDVQTRLAQRLHALQQCSGVNCRGL
jgi:N-acetylglucosamine-6-sulfatase